MKTQNIKIECKTCYFDNIIIDAHRSCQNCLSVHKLYATEEIIYKNYLPKVCGHCTNKILSPIATMACDSKCMRYVGENENGTPSIISLTNYSNLSLKKQEFISLISNIVNTKTKQWFYFSGEEQEQIINGLQEILGVTI